MRKYPLCPWCKTEVVPRDDKYDCPGCGKWFYQRPFPPLEIKKKKGE